MVQSLPTGKMLRFLMSPFMTMSSVDSRDFYAVSNADPAHAGHVRVGQVLAIEMTAPGGSVVLEGKVVFVSPVVDPASGLMRLKVKFANPEGRVRPGAAGLLQVPASNGP